MRGRHSDWTDGLRQHASRRLHYALSRFSRRISLVTVRIRGAWGARPGAEGTCRILVNLLREGQVDVEETQPDLHAAVARAAERAGRAVGRALERERYWDAGPARAEAGGAAA